jgi:hypothetical protein
LTLIAGLPTSGATRRGQYHREAGEKGEANAGIDQIGRARDEQFATPRAASQADGGKLAGTASLPNDHR